MKTIYLIAALLSLAPLHAHAGGDVDLSEFADLGAAGLGAAGLKQSYDSLSEFNAYRALKNDAEASLLARIQAKEQEIFEARKAAAPRVYALMSDLENYLKRKNELEASYRRIYKTNSFALALALDAELLREFPRTHHNYSRKYESELEQILVQARADFNSSLVGENPRVRELTNELDHLKGIARRDGFKSEPTREALLRRVNQIGAENRLLKGLGRGIGLVAAGGILYGQFGTQLAPVKFDHAVRPKQATPPASEASTSSAAAEAGSAL